MPFLYKLALALVAGVLCFGAGWFSHSPDPTPEPITLTKTETKTEIQVQEKIKRVVVREVVHEPSGKTVEKTTETDTEVATKTKETDTAEKSVQTRPTSTRSTNWGLGLTWEPRFAPDVYKPSGAEISHRITGGVWGSLGFSWETHTAILGLRYEW